MVLELIRNRITSYNVCYTKLLRTKYGRGITWGISHDGRPHGDWNRNYHVLLRFDCDLSLDIHDNQMKGHHEVPDFNYVMRHGLSAKQKDRIIKQTESIIKESVIK